MDYHIKWTPKCLPYTRNIFMRSTSQWNVSPLCFKDTHIKNTIVTIVVFDRVHNPRNRRAHRTTDRHPDRHAHGTGSRTEERTGDRTNVTSEQREPHEYTQLQLRNAEYTQLQLSGRSLHDRELADNTYETIASV